MPIKVTCPKCQGVLHAPDDAGGKRGKCPTCGTVLAIPAVAEAAPYAADPPPRSPTPTRLPEPAGPSAIDQDARRSSFGALSDPIPHAARGSSFTGDGRPADPFVKPAPRPASGPATDSEARGYRAARRGLGTVGFAATLFLLAVVAYVVIPLLPKFGVPIPDKTPGFLGQHQLSSLTEIALGVPAILVALGCVFLVLGRSAASSAPRASGARGTLKLASLFTFLAVVGFAASAVPTALAMAAGAPTPRPMESERDNKRLLPADEPSGQAQRAGIAVAAVLAPIAELLFWVGLARLGAGLGDARYTGRVTRYFFYAVVVYAVIALTGYAVYWDKSAIEQLISTNIQPQIDRLGANKVYLAPALTLVMALSVWLIYTRGMSGGRRAIRAWLERHA